MARGRRPARHHATKSMQVEEAIINAVGRLEAAVELWLAGKGLDDIERVIPELKAATSALATPSSHEAEFTREDRIVWAARRYGAAAQAAAKLATLSQLAVAARETALAEMAAAVAIPAVVPRYGTRFIKAMIAEGAGQADLNPPSKARAQAALRAVRQAAPGSSSTPSQDVYREPPVRQWAELPREFAGFRLENVDPDEAWCDLPQLPPYTDIAQFTNDRIDPGEDETQFDTLLRWVKVIQSWAARESVSLDPPAQASWLILLGHRLAPSGGRHMQRFAGQIMRSPWNEGEVVRPVWVESPDQARSSSALPQGDSSR